VPFKKTIGIVIKSINEVSLVTKLKLLILKTPTINNPKIEIAIKISGYIKLIFSIII
jgi:hypothetical protein